MSGTRSSSSARLLERELKLERAALHLADLSRTSGSTSSGLRRGPSTQVRRLTSTAASRSPASSAASSSSQAARISADQSCPGRPGATRTSASTSSGRASVVSSTTRPPSEHAHERGALEAVSLETPDQITRVRVAAGLERRAPEAAQVVAQDTVRRG